MWRKSIFFNFSPTDKQTDRQTRMEDDPDDLLPRSESAVFASLAAAPGSLGKRKRKPMAVPPDFIWEPLANKAKVIRKPVCRAGAGVDSAASAAGAVGDGSGPGTGGGGAASMAGADGEQPPPLAQQPPPLAQQPPPPAAQQPLHAVLMSILSKVDPLNLLERTTHNTLTHWQSLILGALPITVTGPRTISTWCCPTLFSEVIAPLIAGRTLQRPHLTQQRNIYHWHFTSMTPVDNLFLLLTALAPAPAGAASSESRLFTAQFEEGEDAGRFSTSFVVATDLQPFKLRFSCRTATLRLHYYFQIRNSFGALLVPF